MTKTIVSICFLFPLVSTCLNLQNLLALVVSSEGLIQLYAYSNLLLVITGIFLIHNKIGVLSSTNRLWIAFYIVYYCFALWATGMSGFNSSIIATLIPVIYFIGFNFLLSNKEYFNIFFKVITFSFLVSSILTIIIFKTNFSLDTGGFYLYPLDRASGLYGDANNAALASIVSYVLFDKFYNPKKTSQKVLKIILLLTIFYSLFLTFSTTGLFVFTVIFFITNYKFFSGARIILLAVLIALFYVALFSLKSNTGNLNLSRHQTEKIDNIINVLTLNIQEVDNSGRGDLAGHIMLYIDENPILGNGVDFGVVNRAHNTYLTIWADAGIFALILFLIVLFTFLSKSFLLEIRLRFFCVSILFVLYVFMMALQTVINQPYLIVLFVFVGYIIDYHKNNTANIKLFAK